MGLFSSVIHVYQRTQAQVVEALVDDLKEKGLANFERLPINNVNFLETLNESWQNAGLYHLVTEQHGDWTTIVEFNMNVTPPVYLDNFYNPLSKSLDTYTLYFHLHDDDLIFYNLDRSGSSIDGYNSYYQYFFEERIERSEVLDQRHEPKLFGELIPSAKNHRELDAILNEGYWTAFYKEELDEDGVPIDDKYFIDEEDRLVRVGKFLEIFNQHDYPFADWRTNYTKIDLGRCYLLKST